MSPISTSLAFPARFGNTVRGCRACRSYSDPGCPRGAKLTCWTPSFHDVPPLAGLIGVRHCPRISPVEWLSEVATAAPGLAFRAALLFAYIFLLPSKQSDLLPRMSIAGCVGKRLSSDP